MAEDLKTAQLAMHGGTPVREQLLPYGRHEIDETQELYYPAIMKAILKTGYKGYVAQEFIPAKEDKIASLKSGVEICDV